MSQSSKSAYYKALKAQGVSFDRHYRDYNTEELQAAYEKLEGPDGLPLPTPEDPRPVPEPMPAPADDIAEIRAQLAQLTGVLARLAAAPAPVAAPVPVAAPEPVHTPLPPDPMKHAGMTLNTHGPDDPIREDEDGNQWYRNEVVKPGFPKPRGRRVLRGTDSGVVKETITVGGYTETFEIPGDPARSKSIEIKVTLPSFQTGIYKAPNMPFKIHTYQGVRGFDWDDINDYYGDVDLVPASVKRCYVSNDLCYDISSVVRSIETEYRERILKKEAL